MDLTGDFPLSRIHTLFLCMSYKTRSTPPVVLLVFNRPEMTRKMLAPVKAARPETILIVADGPRDSHPKDRERCAAVRELLEKEIDWQPKILTNYSPVNLGCRGRVSSGLTWAFEHVEEAIIMEDDCVADPTFFPFCAELLEYYKTDTRLGVISANNFQLPGFGCDASYYFSRFNHCWGWATWARAWRHYDAAMTQWPRLKQEGWLKGLCPHPLQWLYWEQIFDWVYKGEINSWAYVWTFSCWCQNFLSITPKVNLVSNIGTGVDATHTKGKCGLHDRPLSAMEFPLVHPKVVTPNYPADQFTQKYAHGLAKARGVKAKLRKFLEPVFD